MIVLRNVFIAILLIGALLVTGLICFNYYRIYTITKLTPSSLDTAPDEELLEDEAYTSIDSEFIEKPISTSTPQDQSTETKKPLALYPKAYLVGNIETGDIYFERNVDTVLPVASMSKLVTAFVATDLFQLTDMVGVTERTASTAPDKSLLLPGERFTLSEILWPLLLSSSNVAAESIASVQDRATFMAEMRSYSWEVGMPHSYFADPSGISPHNVASARDMFGLAQYLVKFRPDILDITHTASTTLASTTEHGSHSITSTHPFVHDPDFICGKTGRTPDAGETMLTLMKVGDRSIAIIVIGSKYGAREADTRKLLELYQNRRE